MGEVAYINLHSLFAKICKNILIEKGRNFIRTDFFTVQKHIIMHIFIMPAIIAQSFGGLKTVGGVE